MMSNTSSRTTRGPPVAYNRIQEIPIQEQKRPCTDILCTIIGVLFTLALLITAIVMFHWDNYVKSNFPTDSEGRLCGVDAPGYKYIYFVNAPQMDRRVCVSKCPSPGDTKLDCLMTKNIGCKFNSNPGFEVKQYNVEPFDGGRVGYFCLPTDENLKNQLLANSRLDDRITFINSLDTIVLSMIISIGISIIFLVLVQCLPRVINWIVLGVSVLVILGLAICVYLYYANSSGRILVGVLLTLLFILILLSLIRNRKAITLNGVFLESAAEMFRSGGKWATIFYIPLFIAFLTAFIMIVIYEFRSYWTGGNLEFDTTKSVFWEFNSPGSVVLSVFLIIQTVWGLSFLKQAFNFLISGNAVGWYFNTNWSCLKPFKFLVCNHFGSVVGGSLLTGFLTVPDYIFDLFHPRRHVEKGIVSQDTGCYSKFYHTCCNPCLKLFDLVRSDSMAYINIAGNPYCNAARYCHYMSHNSLALLQSQSTSRTYRLCAHFAIAGIVGLICLYVKGRIVPTSLLMIFFLSVFISTFFISFHADAAEAIAISLVSNEEFIRRATNQDLDINVPYSQLGLVQPSVARKVNQVIQLRHQKALAQASRVR